MNGIFNFTAEADPKINPRASIPAIFEILFFFKQMTNNGFSSIQTKKTRHIAIGAIKKKPAVVETPYGDLIAIRHLMFLSLSYDNSSDKTTKRRDR